MKERWKDVIGYEGLYQVSNLGRVRSLDRVVSHKSFETARYKGKILSLTRDRLSGRMSVGLRKDAIRKVRKVHRIVLEAWVGPCPDGQEGCHEDGDASNNALSNLRWGTKESNERDKRKHGTHGGRRVRRSDNVEFISLHVAAEETGCNAGNIWNVCHGIKKTAGGYGWTYL